MESVKEMQLRLGDGIGERKICPIPDVFRRIEFRSISREELCMESRMLIKERLNGTMAVDCSAIPQENDRSSQMLEQREQEYFDILIVEAPRTELHV